MREIQIHEESDLEGLRKAGRLTAECLDHITGYIQPGVTTNTLDRICNTFIQDHHAIPSCLGYRGYPKSICTSLNHVVCHGIPDETPLKEGDILNIDTALELDGWFGDTSRMYILGQIPKHAKRLVEVTYHCLDIGIAAAKPGNTTGAIGAAIQAYASKHKCSVVRDYCGHGIGRDLHEPPSIMHFGEKESGVLLQPGMVFTIEPMINLGTYKTRKHPDGWTVSTKDRLLSAQAEHMVAITETGNEILTESPSGIFQPEIS